MNADGIDAFKEGYGFTMTIEQARYIVKVAELGTIQKAAQVLFVSQSAISQSLSVIESDLGMPIFNRTRTGCELTTFGEEIHKRCQLIVTNVDIIEALPKMKVSREAGNVTVNTANYGLCAYIPQVISMFRRTYPNYEVSVKELDYPDMLRNLDNNACDFGVAIVLESTYQELVKRYECHILSESYLMVGVSQKSQLAGLSALTPEQLNGNMLALSNASFAQALCKVSPHFSIQDVLFYTNNFTLIQSAIIQKLAVGIFTDLSLYYNKSFFESGVSTVPLVVDGKRPASYFVAILPNNKPLKQTARDLFEIWIKYAEFSPLVHGIEYDQIS